MIQEEDEGTYEDAQHFNPKEEVENKVEKERRRRKEKALKEERLYKERHFFDLITNNVPALQDSSPELTYKLPSDAKKD